jgi:hypothetical protein
VSSQKSQVNNEDIVKMEDDKSSPFKPWRNSQLLDHMRKSGKKAENALKVEDIIAMSQYSFLNNFSGLSEGHAESIRASNSVSSSKANNQVNSSHLKALVYDLFNKE